MAETRPTLLVIDDHREHLDLLGAWFGEDVALRVATTAKEGLAQAQAPGAELVLLGLDGKARPDLRAALQAQGIPFVELPGPGKGKAGAALEGGALDILEAPLEPLLVKTRVGNYLELVQYRDFIRSLARVDPVTGLANDRRFEEFLELEWRRSLRARTEISLVLVELDRMDAFREHQGPEATEALLAKVGEALSGASQRPGDLLAHLGGATFAAVLPDTDRVGTVSVAERMRAEIATLGLSGDQGPLTASFGTATSIPDALRGSEHLVEVAWARLVDAQTRGGNRVEFG